MVSALIAVCVGLTRCCLVAMTEDRESREEDERAASMHDVGTSPMSIIMSSHKAESLVAK